MLEEQQFHNTQTETQTQTQGNSQWELMESNCEPLPPQKVTWGQMFTNSITINDNVRKFVVFQERHQFSECPRKRRSRKCDHFDHSIQFAAFRSPHSFQT